MESLLSSDQRYRYTDKQFEVYTRKYEISALLIARKQLNVKK